MGFDNECILNIQSLAGEYFCPVCRLLVYPNEALQSQCTHLFCKPCLTYVVSTTQACPYDGYLVTEADAKPLVESNKNLAETIGKIAVHCLYHRSGCTWQGPLFECTSHCSGCAFGNSPVVCNRCGVQIVHCQVQEHAQNCPGVQPQAQQAEGALDTSASGTSATADQTQPASQAGIATSQSQASQTTSATTPGSDPNQKANSISQAQAVVQAAVPSAEQWYQQQQQYQQYYQQYPGYDPYQQQSQNYYPYQQAAVPQSQQQNLQSHPYGTVQHQPQTYLQPQPQTQPPLQPQPQPQIQLPHVQAPIAAQTQNQAQVNQQLQLHPAAHGQSHPQPLPYFQTPSHSQPHPQHVQMPHNQQAPIQQHNQSQLHPQHHPLSQPQPQPQAQLQQHPQPRPSLHPSQPMNATIQPQSQHPSSHAVTGNHLYPQPHLQQPVQSGAPQQHTMHVQSHGVPQSQTPVQIQSQFPQQPLLMRPPASHTTIPSQQQPALLPSPGQGQNINPAQQQPVHAYAQQPGNTIHPHPLMQAVQQPIPQQYFHHQPYVQQQPPAQLRPQGQSHSFPQHVHASTQSQGVQHIHSNLGGWPLMPSHGAQSQTHAQTAGGVQARPMHPAVNLPSTNQSNMVRINSLVQSGANSRPTMSVRQPEKESELPAQQNTKIGAHDVGATSDVVAHAEPKTMKSEMGMKSIDDENKPTGEDKTNQGDASSKEIPDIHALENGESVSKSMLKEEGVDGTMEHSTNLKLGEVVAESAKDVPRSDMKQRELKEIPAEEAQLRDEQGRMSQKDASGIPLLHVLPGPPHHIQGPGHPLNHLRPHGPAHVPGQPFHSSEYFRPSGGNPGFGASSGRASQYGPQGCIEQQSVTPHGTYNQGHLPPPSHTGAPRVQGEPVGGPPFGSVPTSAFDSHGGMMAKTAPYGSEGQRSQQHPATQMEQGAIGQLSGIHPNMLRLNGTPGLDSSSPHGSRDERFKVFPEERLNPFPVDPTRRVINRVEFEDDVKKFPRPPYPDSEPVSRFGNYSSRPFSLNTDPASGAAPSRFLPPYHLGGMHGNDAGDFGRMEPSHGHPDFGGRRPMDGVAPRSPVRDYPGIPSHGFRGFGPDDFDGREFHRFGDPHGNQFHEGRFSNLPSNFRMGEFEGPGNMRVVDHMRNDFIGRDGHPGHLRRGEHLGPHNLPSHLHLRDPSGFGARHSLMGDMAGPGNFESFRGNRPNHPRLGELGFRSSFSLQRFPNDGTYTGDLESFDHSRKRKPASMGWCRICKVDCETVEGLDLHSQTREHQKMAMDMVRSIKQNAKKQKLTSGDQPLVEDSNKSKFSVLKAGEKSLD